MSEECTLMRCRSIDDDCKESKYDKYFNKIEEIFNNNDIEIERCVSYEGSTINYLCNDICDDISFSPTCDIYLCVRKNNINIYSWIVIECHHIDNKKISNINKNSKNNIIKKCKKIQRRIDSLPTPAGPSIVVNKIFEYYRDLSILISEDKLNNFYECLNEVRNQAIIFPLFIFNNKDLTNCIIETIQLAFER